MNGVLEDISLGEVGAGSVERGVVVDQSFLLCFLRGKLVVTLTSFICERRGREGGGREDKFER